MSTPIPPQTSQGMREPGNSTIPTPPPPAYQDSVENNFIGETYYQPPPPTSYAPPLPTSYATPPSQPAMGTRVAEFYSPPNDRRLAMRRRLSSCFCILLIVVIIIGLAAGLTRSSYNRCECQSDADCIGLYGAGVYCYSNCECATK